MLEALSKTKLPVRRPLIEATRHQPALTDTALIEHWCQRDTLRLVAEFAAQKIKRKAYRILTMPDNQEILDQAATNVDVVHGGSAEIMDPGLHEDVVAEASEESFP